MDCFSTLPITLHLDVTEKEFITVGGSVKADLPVYAIASKWVRSISAQGYYIGYSLLASRTNLSAILSETNASHPRSAIIDRPCE